MKNTLINTYAFYFKLVPFFIVLLMLSACSSIKPGATKSGKKYFETFYVGEQGTQYFIKPILLHDEESNEDLILDFTFRYRNEIKDSAIVNFSIQSAAIYKSLDSLKFINQEVEIESKQLVLLFNEKNKKGFTSRFSTKLSLKEIKKLFNNDDWVINIHNQNETNTYQPSKKSSKAINILRDKVFVLM